MKALYGQQNSPGEEMTFVLQERVSSLQNSSVHQAVGQESLAECHRGIEAQKSCAGLGKDWQDPGTHRRKGKEGRGGAFCHQAALAKTTVLQFWYPDFAIKLCRHEK